MANGLHVDIDGEEEDEEGEEDGGQCEEATGLVERKGVLLDSEEVPFLNTHRYFLFHSLYSPLFHHFILKFLFYENSCMRIGKAVLMMKGIVK